MIKGIADLVDPQHKVHLEAPDKVILVEIYQVGLDTAHSMTLLS